MPGASPPEMTEFMLNTSRGQKLASSLLNITSHYDYLMKLGYMDAQRKKFMEDCLFNFTDTLDLPTAYFLKQEKNPSTQPFFYSPYSTRPTRIIPMVPETTEVFASSTVPVVTETSISSIVPETTEALNSELVNPATSSIIPEATETFTSEPVEVTSPIVPETAQIFTSEPVDTVISVSNTKGIKDEESDDEDFDFFSLPYDPEANRSMYADPPRSVLPSWTKKNVQGSTKSVTNDNSENLSSFLQRCGQKGIKLSPSQSNTIEAPKVPITEIIDAKDEVPMPNVAETIEVKDEVLNSDVAEAIEAKDEVPESDVAKSTEVQNSAENIEAKNTTEVPKPDVTEIIEIKGTEIQDLPITVEIEVKHTEIQLSSITENIETEIQESHITENVKVDVEKSPVIENLEVQESTETIDATTEAPKSDVTEGIEIGKSPTTEVIEVKETEVQKSPISENIRSKPTFKPAGYGGVSVKYITDEGTFERDGKVDFVSKALARGCSAEMMLTRHNSGVVVVAIFSARGGVTGGPRGNMKSLRFEKGDRLKIRKMLGNGWYLARKVEGDDDEYATVRIFRMEIGANLARKTQVTGDTSASPAYIVCRAPSPDQDFTYIPPHLRPAAPNSTPNIQVEAAPIVRKRYHEILYFDGRAPQLVNETVTAVIH